MLYSEFLTELESYRDETYREFHKKLLKNESLKVLGVRIPRMRQLAKKYKGELETFMSFPDEYYEVTFVKLTIASLADYDTFIKYLDKCVSLIDNWATCDCFSPKCIAKHKEQFLPVLREYAATNKEFYQRFALTALLKYYMDEQYLETVFSLTEQSDTSFYYVHMAAAWLIAETLVKHYERAVGFLNEHSLDKKTHNKAIQKALESYRLSNDRKNFLKGLKR